MDIVEWYTTCMKKLDVFAFANTLAIIDMVLHPLFHIWGWFFPKLYEAVMSEFVIGLSLNVSKQFEPTFFVFWIFEAVSFWILGYAIAYMYNKLAK